MLKIGKRQIRIISFSIIIAMFLISIPSSEQAYAATSDYTFQNGTLTILTNVGSTKWRSDSTISKTAVTSIICDSSVTEIGYGAFQGCSGLTSITLPNSLTSIGYGAFYGCSGLTSITLPNSLTSIGLMAFWGCSGLTSITLPNSLTSISGNAFYECSGLTSITLPNSLTSIGGSAFNRCSGLTSITLPNSLTEIGDRAFNECSGLTSITLPNSLTEIGDGAFIKCSGLTSITLPNSLTEIGDSAFSGCSGLTSITLPDGLTSINRFAFQGCSGLTSITLPNSLTSIGRSAFNGCSGLTSITIPANVRNIDLDCFTKCTNLTTINMLSNTPCKMGDSMSNLNENLKIYVPIGYYQTYKDANTWGSYAKYLTVEGYSISGTITGSDTSAGIPATLQLTRNNINVDTSVTASSMGAYTIRGVSSGAYTIEISCIGYQSKTINPVTVTNSDLTEINETLTAIPADSGFGGGTSSSKPSEPVSGSSNTTADVDSKGNAKVTITENNILEAIQAAKKAASEKGVVAGDTTAIIHIASDGKSIHNLTVNLPKDIQEYTLDQKLAKLVLVMDKLDVSLGIDLAAIKEMNKQAENDIQIVTNVVDSKDLSEEAYGVIGKRPVFDFKAVYANGSKTITNFGNGTVTISLPYALASGEKASNVCGIYVDKNGKVNYIKDSVYNETEQQMQMDTNHFSVYGVGYTGQEADTTKKKERKASYQTLQLQAKGGKNQNVLTWKPVKNADGYIVYGAACGSKEMKVLKVITKKDTTRFQHTKLKAGTYYKYQVKAYQVKENEKEIQSVSKLIHSATTGSKKGDPVKVTITPSTLTLAKKQQKQISGKVAGESKKEIKEHTTTLRYESSNPTIATVSSTGVITAKGEGFCYIYVYAQNGMSKKVLLTVE